MTQIMGVDPTQVHTSASFKLGTRAQDAGGREFVYVGADAAITAGDACIVHEDYGAQGITTTLAAAGTGQGKQVGVAMATLASGEFGWLCIFGTGTDVVVKVSASCAAFTTLQTTATAGQLDDAATAAVAGIVLIAANGGSAATVQAVLTYPRV